jgi:hypothetical protein
MAPAHPLGDLTVNELLVRYLRHCENYYRQGDGTPAGRAEQGRRAADDADVEALLKQRVEVASRPGLSNYRCVLLPVVRRRRAGAPTPWGDERVGRGGTRPARG